MTAADARRLAFLSELGAQVAAHVADANVDTVPEDDLARPGRKPTRDEIAAVLIAEGAEPGNSIHSWRCEYPAHYGPCDCVAKVADALLDLYDRAAKGEL